MKYRIISLLIGSLLLAAAVLKLQGLAVDPVARVGLFSASWFQVLVIEMEVGLGLWLLWGKHRVGAWLATLATFTTFAGFSFYSGWIGQASCGCFGKLALSPWWAFAVDAVVVVGLLVVRPPFYSPPRERGFFQAARPMAALVLAYAAILGAMTAGASYGYGSMDAALAQLRGEQITLKPDGVDVGIGPVGDEKEATMEIRNWTDRSMRIIGGTSDCSCVTTRNLPLELAPGATRSISVGVRLPDEPGIFTRSAFLWIDDGRMRTIPFRITGRAR